MNQSQVDAVVAGMLRDWFPRGLRDLYRDLRDEVGGPDAAHAMTVACRKAYLGHGDLPLPTAHRWYRIFNRLDDAALPAIADL